MLVALKEIISQPFPVGKILKEWEVPHNGLKIKRVTCPIGRILIIYESRPNVTLDAFALCFKSGNSCILRGGRFGFAVWDSRSANRNNYGVTPNGGFPDGGFRLVKIK